MLSDPSFHPLAGICIILFLTFIFVFTICGYTFELYLSLGARIFFSLILTAVGGLSPLFGGVSASWKPKSPLCVNALNQLEQP